MRILDVKIDNVNLEESLEKADKFLNSDSFHFIVTPNPEIILRARKDNKFKEILNAADLSIADGIGLLFAAKFFGTPLKERVTGVDFTLELCALAEKSGKSVFLLGGRDGIAEKAAEELKKRFPALKIAGAMPAACLPVGTGRQAASGAKADKFRPENISADILFVAFGAPKQEKWISANARVLNSNGVKIALGVGGAFDIISGRLPRAPLFLRKIGLEWLWRLGLEPRRLKRIFNAVIIFPLVVFALKFKLGNSVSK